MDNIAKKWNYITKKWEKYELPVSAVQRCDDYMRTVACAGCGRRINYGDGHFSGTIIGKASRGYVVCGNCYGKER